MTREIFKIDSSKYKYIADYQYTVWDRYLKHRTDI